MERLEFYIVEHRGEFGPYPVDRERDGCLGDALIAVAKRILYGKRYDVKKECLKTGEYIVQKVVVHDSPMPEEVKIEKTTLYLEVYVKRPNGRLLIRKLKYAPEGTYRVYLV